MPAAFIIDPTPTLTRKEAIAWLIAMHESVGPNFHPDIPAVDYDPPLKAGHCARVDAMMRGAFAVLGDEVYDVVNVHSPRRRAVRAA